MSCLEKIVNSLDESLNTLREIRRDSEILIENESNITYDKCDEWGELTG